MTGPVHDLAVVGGGITGLAAGWWAAQSGRDVRLLEEGERFGGVLRTDRVGAYLVERAATTVPTTAKHVLALVASLPHPPTLVPAGAPQGTAADVQWLLTRRGLVPAPRTPRALLATSLLPLGAKVRLFAEALRGPREGARAESLDRFVARRFGRGVAERFLGPFTRGIYGADPARLGAGDAFPGLVALERRRGSVLKALFARKDGLPRKLLRVAGGMDRLPEAIAAALGERASTRARVEALRPAAVGSDEPLELVLAAGERVRAREVLLAVPPPRQAALLRPFAPDLAEALAAVSSTPIAVVALGLSPDSTPLPPGLGFLRAPGSRARILGATFASQLAAEVAPPGHHLASVYLGGSEDPEALALNDAALVALATADLARALGGPVRTDMADVHRWPHAIPLFSPGHRGRMARMQARLSARRIRLSGSHVTGVALDACVAPGTSLGGDRRHDGAS